MHFNGWTRTLLADEVDYDGDDGNDGVVDCDGDDKVCDFDDADDDDYDEI